MGSIWTAGAAALILALAFLTISSSSAFAAAGHSALRTISTGPTSTPRAVAADSGGNLYVLEMGGRRVEKFDSTGNPVPFVASAPYVEGNKLIGTVAGPFPEFLPWRSFNIGVDNSGGPNDGNIYLAIEREEGASAVLVYAATGAYLGRLGGTGEYRCAVAVNPTDGSVFVGQGGGLLRYPTPSGTLEAAIPNGELHSGACPVAADSAGAVYVGDGPIRKYAASQFDVASPTPSLEFESGSSLGLALDPTNGDLYADKGGKIIKWNAAGTQQGEPFGQLSDSRGLAVDSAQNISAVDSGGGVFVFGPDEVQLPAGTTGGSSNLTPIGADVEGSVDPDGAGDITACEFRYGEDTGYSAGSAPCAPGAPISSPSSVSATLSGLVSGTTYHYRLFLTNANGTQMSTGDQTFTTPPATESVATGQASAVEKDRAQLNGSYTGDGQEVHYFFEWGKTNGYGHTTPAPPDGNAGTASGPQNVAPVQISGLEPTTTYHYRLVVSTASGITRGQDETLTTGVAVDNLTADAPTVVADTSAELRASFDGDGNETHYYFEWGPTRDYGSTTPAPPGNAVPGGSGRIEVPPVSISGLESGSTYHFRVVASNSVGTTVSGDQSFRAAEAPLVGNLNTRNVKPTSAELTGEINPRFGQTSYRFDWGPTATYGNSVPVPAGNAGSGDSLVPVSAQLEGLTPGATYHFRLVATNQFGTTTSADQTFGFFPPACPNSQLRQETRSNDLPDCRAYELVTPSFAQGAEIMPAAGPTSGLAINPARIAYAVNYGTFAASTGEGTNSLGDLYVSTRSDSGWTQRYNGLPGSQAIFMGGPPGAVLYSPSNTLSSAESQRGTQASPTLDRVISYNWGYPGQITWKSVGSNAPYVWEASSGRLIERWPSNLAEVGDEHFAGIPQASADLSHFVFSSNVVFADGGTARDEEIACCSGNYSNNAVWPRSSIYDNDLATRTVALASVRSDGTPFEGRAFDISADGSHILMTEEANLQGTAGSLLVPREAIAGAEITGPLFLRVDGTRTYEIAPGHQIQYAGSSADGATVYLSSDDQLTPDDHDTSRDLFVWHESDPNLLTRVSIGNHGNAGNTDECAPNEGWSTGCGASIIAIKAPRSPAGAGGNGYTDNFLASKSGDLYFESPEQLVGLKGELGERNIYLYRGGTLRYVATMEPSRRILRMQVTPDGRYMALVTGSSLTEYNSGGHWEMYLYGSDSGRVACVSCRPDGQQPVSDVRGSQNGLFLTYDGRAFFSSMDSLVPRDTNEALDIYEFTEGKAQLITSGTGAERGLQSGPQNETGLVNVSANGTDVYFATIDNLVTQDHNGAQIKVYDARTGGGFPAEREATKCVAADECHGAGNSPPAPPADRTSANFGTPHKAKSHKAKKHKKAHKHGKHKKKKRAGKSKSKRQSNGKQGGMRHG